MKIAIIGFGWVARDYMLPAIAAHTGARLCAVVSVRAADFEGLDPAIGRYTDAAEMLRREQPEAVYVASPNHLHAEHVLLCARAGVDVLCEKPLAATYADAERLVGAALDADIAFATAYDQRHHPAHRLLRTLLSEGRLGIITQARIDYACWLPADWSADNWRIDRAKAGGGAIIDLAPHGLDLLEHLLDSRIVALHCYQQRAVQRYAVDDGGMLTARLANGTLASLSVGYNRPETLPRRRLEIQGTKGAVIAENTMGQTPGGTLTFIDAATGRSAPLSFDTETGPFYHQLDAFLRFCHTREGRHPTEDLRLARLLETALDQSPLPDHPASGAAEARTAQNISLWP